VGGRTNALIEKSGIGGERQCLCPFYEGGQRGERVCHCLYECRYKVHRMMSSAVLDLGEIVGMRNGLRSRDFLETEELSSIR